MREPDSRAGQPRLKELVAEASRALARLDAERLEELALSCQALNRDLGAAGAVRRRALALEAREAVHDMAVYARVLEVTRGNLNVMRRLRELRLGQLEYGGPQQGLVRGWTERGYGDN
ncbi:MAG: hypothetical protein ACRD3N_00265 [Terracidiphilus sp.]